MTENQKVERFGFQTETKQLLNLMIHSLYSHKEVFIRELISNASDALDKLRFESLTNPSILGEDKELCIRVKVNSKAKTITISDNGIGMTKSEVIENIGTIARSGSKIFLEKITEEKKFDSNLIGQFGVGFYSAFMVASKVKLVTKKAGTNEKAIAWESDGKSDEYIIYETDKETRGTDVIVYLKEEEGNYSDAFTVRNIIKKFSDFIAFPIYFPNEKGHDEILNQTKPLWLRPPQEITSEQYEEFFRQLGGYDKLLATIHSKAEGILEYSFVLFLPQKAPFDIFLPERTHGVKLYVKRVFITDKCKELMPEYLRFVKGVVDSEDLPLNISREMLQQNPIIEKIRKTLVSKILQRLMDMASNEPSNYKIFWNNFGSILKEGIHTDLENKEKITELLRYKSTLCESEDDWVSLSQYVSRMREGQKYIYYISGENKEALQKSPHLEIFKEKSIEVLYFLDPIDEFIVNDLYDYKGKQLKSITKGELDLGELDKEDKKQLDKVSSKYKKLAERIKNILSGQVKDVRLTFRLKESPCCIVKDEHDMGPLMEKMFKAMGQEIPQSIPVLELNASHPVIENLNILYEKDPKSTLLEEWVKLLFDHSIIMAGEQPKDISSYSKRVNELLLKSIKETVGP